MGEERFEVVFVGGVSSHEVRAPMGRTDPTSQHGLVRLAKETKSQSKRSSPVLSRPCSAPRVKFPCRTVIPRGGIPPLLELRGDRLLVLLPASLSALDRDRTAGYLRERGLQALVVVDGLTAVEQAHWNEPGVLRLVCADTLRQEAVPKTALGRWARFTVEELGGDTRHASPTDAAILRSIETIVPITMNAWNLAAGTRGDVLRRLCPRHGWPLPGCLMRRILALTGVLLNVKMSAS